PAPRPRPENATRHCGRHPTRRTEARYSAEKASQGNRSFRAMPPCRVSMPRCKIDPANCRLPELAEPLHPVTRFRGKGWPEEWGWRLRVAGFLPGCLEQGQIDQAPGHGKI